MVEFGIKAYGTAAAVSVALSDAETVAGKSGDALGAVGNLAGRYREAQYVVEHREEIETSIDYVNEHAPGQAQLEAATQESAETLAGIETTYDELVQAKEAFGPSWGGVKDAAEHVANAWDARPDLDSIRNLAEVAESAVPFVRQVEVLVPALYGGLLTLADNFASDEIRDTVSVMLAALAVAFVIATGFGFLARRGRPGLISRTLQTLGARLFPGWYVHNLEFALGRPLYAAARRHTQNEILIDPQQALDPAAFQELELYFEQRLRGGSPGSSGPPRASTRAAKRSPGSVSLPPPPLEVGHVAPFASSSEPR